MSFLDKNKPQEPPDPGTPPSQKDLTWLWGIPTRCPKYGYSQYEEPVPQPKYDMDDDKLFRGGFCVHCWEV